jgi:hypothetical protein
MTQLPRTLPVSFIFLVARVAPVALVAWIAADGSAIVAASSDTVRFDAAASRKVVLDRAGMTVAFDRPTSGEISVTNRSGDPGPAKLVGCDGTPILSLPRYWTIDARLETPAGLAVTVEIDPREIPPPLSERHLRIYGYDDPLSGWVLAPGPVDPDSHTVSGRFPQVPNLLVVGEGHLCAPTGLRVR